MKIDSEMLYGPCPCGSGKKFKFCCWPKCRDRIDADMTEAEIVQTVRCEGAGVYKRTDSKGADNICEKGRQTLLNGSFEEARPFFRKAREIDPKMWIAWNNEAICAWEMGNVEEAYELQLKGIEACNGRNTFGAAAIAIFCHVLGHDDEACEWMDRACADKLPLSRDIAAEVCIALALFRRHRDIVEYASASGFAEDGKVAFFLGTAFANLGEFEKARKFLEMVDQPGFEFFASLYVENIKAGTIPYSVYDDWPYFWSGNFAPARWFDKDIGEGRDPFAKYPSVAPDAIDVLVSEGRHTPAEMLKLLDGRTGERSEKLRKALKELAEARIVDDDGKDLGWAPGGVTALNDEDRLPILRPMPKWRMEYEVSETGELEEEVDAVLGKLVRPYVERYCCIADNEDAATLEIAVQQIRFKKGKPPLDGPTITMGTYAKFWPIMRHQLEEVLEWQPCGTLVCEVRYDQMFGGPILTIENAKEEVEMFMVALPDYFGEDD